MADVTCVPHFSTDGAVEVWTGRRHHALDLAMFFPGPLLSCLSKRPKITVLFQVYTKLKVSSIYQV